MKSKTETNLWRFRGNRDEDLAAEQVEPNLFSNLIGATPADGKVVRCGENREGAEADVDIEVAADDLVEVELDDGLILYLSASRFEELVKPRASRSGDDNIKTIPQSFTIGSQQTRGLGGFVLKAFRVLKLTGEIAEYSAEKIAEKLEQQLLGGSGGLIKWDSDSASWSNVDAVPDKGKPLLLFLHGTASSTEGSFKHLWEENSEDWKRLNQDYADNIFAFEHPSLSRSPVENAINLLKRLPDNATLHLVSHSRGGLVGELLCHGQLLNQQAPFSDEDFQFFDEGEGVQAEQLRSLGELLQQKNLTIERFLRVACPARGTTLASERLDIYLSGVLNLVGLVTGLKSSPVYGFLQALTLAVAKQRTKPQVLPGLEAMMPESPFIAMLNRPGKTSSAHLAVIKGDIDPSGIMQRIALLMVDSFYRADHDLVVNTDSMSGGIKRVEWGAMFDEGSEVNHFNYFTNLKTRKGMVDALLSPELPPAFELPPQDRLIRSWESSRGAGADSPIAIVLPGISGTHLEVDGKRIWLDLGEIFKGNLLKLDVGKNPTLDARPVMAKYYNDLLQFLGKTHRVIPFPYDWRKSILDASDRLAEALAEQLQSSTQPIHIFAHSMGGLVARGLIANHPALWQAVTARKGSRLLMLGTPNSGSYSILRLLAGRDRLSAMLGLVDFRHDENALLKLLSCFPGLLELLPLHGDVDAYSADIWGELKSAFEKQAGFFGDDPLSDFNTQSQWTPPTQKALNAARRTWKKLNSVVLDARYTAYIAGQADSTPIAMKIRANGKIKFIGTPLGDGRVPWNHGIPDDVPCWYVNAAHGDLANHEASFAGLLEIANTGDTRLLSKTRPVTRGVTESLDIPGDSIEFYPDESDIANAFTGSEPWRKKPQHEPQQIISISVAHGNLQFSKSPLMAGHYAADAIVSAEKAMDERLQGRLQQRHDLGLYPGRLQSSLVVLDRDLSGREIGAIIVGLGKVGELSAGKLSDTIRHGLMEYALACSNSTRRKNQPISISSLLVGSGEGGLTLPDVIAAILDGLIEANRALAGNAQKFHQTIQEFQFVELFEDTAAYAQRTLLRLSGNPRYRKLIKVEAALNQTLNGGHRRIAHIEDESWWERIQVNGADTDTKKGEIKFLYLTNRARAEGHLVATQRRLVDQILAQATKSSSIDRKLSQTLFELLLPQEFKQRAADRRNMMLILDEEAAKYPWELLEYIDDEGNSQAPSTSAGMIRQLAANDYTRRPNMISNRKALVVGDPLSDAPELRGAQQEAKQVDKVLKDHLFEANTLIRPEGLQVITELMTGKFQLIHLAAHGVYDYKTDKDAESVSGMLLGNGLFLTSAEIARLSSVPELVFINCCHLGRISGKQQEYVESRHKLAANLATSLIQKGVKAVVAAGWVVDDQAATLFAQQFYTAMFDGEDFGEAVRGAREMIRQRYPNCNTWGAYQCYGDPHYRLQSATSRKKSRRESVWFVCEQEVVIALQNLVSDAVSATDGQIEGLKRKLEEIKTESTQWHDSAKVQVAFGAAYAELDQFPNAINAYTKASRHEISHISVKAIEQLCNLQARHAVDLHNQNESQQAEELIDKAIKRLESIHDALEPSVERLALLGSTYKRQAMTLSSGFITPLSRMYDNYRKADELALEKQGEVYCYTRLNRLTAQLLLNMHSKSKKYSGLDEFDTQLLEAESATESFVLHRENFWDAIALTDCKLLRALYENNLHRDAESILEHYQEQKKRMGSPRQFRSVLENLLFLQQLLKTKRAADAQLIEGIHSGLS